MENDTLLMALFSGAIVTMIVLWIRDTTEPSGRLPDATRFKDSPFDAERVQPAPDLVACQCSNCRRIRCTDQRWLPEPVVPLPIGCRISHGICPSCERRTFREIEAMTPIGCKA